MATTQLINNKFAIFSTEAKLDAAVTAGYLQNTSIAFCKEAGKEFIWTHGTKFRCDFSRSEIQSAVVAINDAAAGKPVNSIAIQNLLTSLGFASDGNTGTIPADHVTYEPQITSGEGVTPVTYDTTVTNVQDAIEEIYSTISLDQSAYPVTISRTTGGSGTWDKVIHADGNTYTISQNGETLAHINIARDMVVSSGSVITATSAYITAHSGENGDIPSGVTLVQDKKYVRLVVNNSSDGKNIYIPVDELVDVYNFTDSDEIDFSEQSTNNFTATIKSSSIAKGKLTTTLQNEITSARTTLTEKSTGHVRVTKAAGSGATPDNYAITEDDIASAADVANIPRIQSKPSGFVTVTVGNGNNPTAVVSDTIGELPQSGTGSDATSVIDYVDKKVAAMGGENLWEPGTATGSLKTKSNQSNTSAIAGVRSIAAGNYTETNNIGEAAFGVYNNSATHESNANGQTIFSVGIGTGTSDRLNGIDIRKNGDLYIIKSGTTATKLQDEINWYEDLT